MHCNSLQQTATRGNTLYHSATHCPMTLDHDTATYCNALRRTATHCNTSQHATSHCNNTLPRGVVLRHCNALQHSDTTIHRNTLQHTATRRNTLHHTAQWRWTQTQNPFYLLKVLPDSCWNAIFMTPAEMPFSKIREGNMQKSTLYLQHKGSQQFWDVYTYLCIHTYTYVHTYI